MLNLDDIVQSAIVLTALGVPGAFARICLQLAMDKDLPRMGFPGLFKGGCCLVGSLALAVGLGLLCMHTERLRGWEYTVAIAVGFLAQDVFVWMVKQGRNPLSLVSKIVSAFTKK